MIRSALSSAALLGSSIDEVLKTAAGAKVNGVEWSDDGFLEPGDEAAAGAAMLATLRAGLCTVSYATLYRPGVHAPAYFDRVLATAKVLQSPVIRLYSQPPRGMRRGEAKAFAALARPLGDRAGERGVTLCFGLARGSTFDGYRRAADALDKADHPFVKLCWEPLPGIGFDEAMESLSALRGRIGLLCARATGRGPRGALLREREEDWLHYVDAYDEQGGSPDMARYVVIRSFKDADAANLAKDAGMVRLLSDKLRRYRRRRLY